MGRGLSGGVSRGDDEPAAAAAARRNAARCAWASGSDAGAEALRAMFRSRSASLRAPAGACDWGADVGAPERGRTSPGDLAALGLAAGSSKQMVQGLRRPSVTINGVGP